MKGAKKRLFCMECGRSVHEDKLHGVLHRSHRVYPLNEWRKPKYQPRVEHAYLSRFPKHALPSSIDLTPLLFNAAPETFPFDQGQQGSCTACAGCADVALCAVKLGLYGPSSHVPLNGWSVAFQYWCERNPPFENEDGKDTGAFAIDVGNSLAYWGCCFDSTFPYHSNTCYTPPPQSAYDEATKWKFVDAQNPIMPDQFPAAIAAAQATANLGSVRIAVPVPSSFMYAVDHGGFVPMPQDTETLEGGHEMLLLGYDDNLGFPDGSKGGVIVLNSWGDCGSTGQYHGLLYIPYAWFTCNWVQRYGPTENYQQASKFSGSPNPQPGPTNTWIYTTAGTYNPSVTVTDSAGNTITFTTTVTVQGSPQPNPLTGNLSASPNNGTAPLLVNFQTTVTGGSPPYSYAWHLPQ